jgi:Domain of unknown function (DUF4282)/zinc-ribbon domain
MDKGFFSSLLDLSFTSFVTTKIVKVLYVLSLILIAITALVFVVAGFQESAGLGLFMLVIGAPLGALLYTIYTRVILEFIIQVFRIGELLRDQGEVQRQAFTAAGWLGARPAPATSVPPAPPASPGGPEAATTTAAAIAASCPNCGAATTPGARFCRSCGHQLG